MKSLSVVSEEDLNKFYQTISNNVQRIRQEKNKPQLDLVLEMGLKSTSFYSKCENAKDNHHFNLEHIYKIAVALNVDILEFFKGVHTTT
ncbi:XRE family transcriptional regulator [Sulfurimonas sp. CVO]|jgi:transcriptional regulator with XRE-family HTH domain|uniref:Helix-turn-helix transcriptional regulator n=1 Tax=Sulfurimonas xiamenensis TaxID=2590021 RepID=A0AAJ4A4U7_9BACT|nr:MULTISPECIES: helix-turn-helix transcriptional regulator [Sulfurimonas]PLY13095.1 MAG: XRE family transcriptional regulator [Sulfurimonas sp.]QFR43920.1 helix-turn-helix transcriptional regulator [Sulfurimonas xiamenensis]QHG90542.1 XRE family transcriptional regulator [Sulfurimonas sp. CVO]